MKQKLKGFSKVWIAVAVLVAAFVAIVGISYANKMAENAKLDSVDVDTILDGIEISGGIGDNYTGPKDAKVILFEYADYQCPGCAATFPYLSDLVEEYDGKIALVFRSFVMSYHKNGTAAAAAANAAGLQGYWHEYASLLFENQSDWENLRGEERDKVFDEYFNEVSAGKGDLKKFHSDINSESVKKKISFDAAIAKKIGVNATPSVYLNGKSVEFNTVDPDQFKEIFREAIDAALEK